MNTLDGGDVEESTAVPIALEDITGEIGPLDAAVASPMYSYDAPAYNFWQGAYVELRGRFGWTKEQAIDFLQSKHTRWMFDGTSSEVCEFMGKIMVRGYVIKTGLKAGVL